MDLILMGLRGSGKSTLARMLSARTGLRFVDLDDRVAFLLGRPDATSAWLLHGEQAFRAMESRALTEALHDGFPIVALGGGTPVAPSVAAELQQIKRPTPPRIIYLRAPAETLAARMRRGPDRPSLTGEDPISEVPTVFLERDPIYRNLADHTLELGDMTAEQVCTALLAIAGD